MKETNYKFKNNSDYLSYLYGLKSTKSFIINNEHWKCIYSFIKNEKNINDNLFQKTAPITLAGDSTSTPPAGDEAPTAQAGYKEK